MRFPTSVDAIVVTGVATVVAATLALATATTASGAPPTCADTGGVAKGTTCQIRATDPAYTLSIDYPVDYPDVGPVDDYVRQTRDGFLNVAKMPGPQTMPYELDTTATQYASTVPPRNTQSLVFKTYQDLGGAHPVTFYKSFTWDRTGRKPVTIDTLFRDGTQPFLQIYPVVQAELSRQLGQPVIVPPGVGLDSTKYQNFALTNDAIIFFFGQGELLPESAGALQVSVPRGPLEPILA